VERIYTKNGTPVQVSGDHVHSRSGRYIGRLSGGRLYGPDGQYIATLDGDRLAYRPGDGALISGAHAPLADIAGSIAANAIASATWGEEPDIPD
jgi:hypothetical protein